MKKKYNKIFLYNGDLNLIFSILYFKIKKIDYKYFNLKYSKFNSKFNSLQYSYSANSINGYRSDTIVFKFVYDSKILYIDSKYLDVRNEDDFAILPAYFWNEFLIDVRGITLYD